MIGVQPTYPVPPPATLYGHVCSAFGERIDPQAFQMGVHFTSQARFRDYEHTHLFAPGSKSAKDQAKLSPTERELLFQPRLTLYINRPDWLQVFQHPHHVVVLGRSQDLMRYVDVRVVTLARLDRAYVEHALLPLEEASLLRQFTALTMPCWLPPERDSTWKRYAVTSTAQPWDAPAWVDPEVPLWRGRHRAVIWFGAAP